ncbi:MAG: GNAT family N-acetyltransferase [Thermomicrobiales bacterium]
MPTLDIAGERVALGPLRRDLIPCYCRWNNDFTTTRTLARSQPLTVDAMTTAYDAALDADDSVDCTIYERATSRPIGSAYLHGIDMRHRTAEFGIVIGEADARGKGYGTETARLMLDYAFTDLGLHTVMLRVYAFNRAGLRAYEKAGFRVFGTRRQCHMMGGRLWDVVYMEAMSNEERGMRLPRLNFPL